MDNTELFVKKAFDAGLTEDQVRQALLERKSRVSSLPERNTQKGFFEKDGGLDQASDLFIGRTKDYIGSEFERQKTLSSKDRNLELLTKLLGPLSMAVKFEDGKPKANMKAIGSMGEIASYMIPAGQLGTGTAGTRIASGALQGAEIGALRGITNPEEMSIEERAGETGLNALMGAGFGAGTQGVLEVGRAGINSLKNLGNKLWSGTLKGNMKADAIINKKYGGVDGFRKVAQENDIPLDLDSVNRQINSMGDDWAKNVDDLIAQSDSKVPVKTLAKNVKKIIKQELNTPETRSEYKAAIKYLDDVIKTRSDDFTAIDAYSLRKFLDKNGARVFTDSPKVNGQKQAMGMLATEINKSIRDNVPDIVPYFDRYRVLKDAAIVYMKEPKFGITNLVGTLAGSPFGIPSTIGATAAATAVRSPAVGRGVGNVLSNISDVAPVQNKLQPVFLNPLMRALENERGSKTVNRRLPNP